MLTKLEDSLQGRIQNKKKKKETMIPSRDAGKEVARICPQGEGFEEREILKKERRVKKEEWGFFLKNHLSPRGGG